MGDLDLDEEEGDSDGDSSLESIRVKGSLEEGQEDGNLLADEWYEACPDYCTRWIFGQHAASILLNELQEGPFALVEALYELCLTHGASTEANRFYDLLNHLGFSPSHSQLTSHSLAVRSASLSHSKAYFASLQATLLSSSFSQRLFYSDFISLTHAQLAPGEEPLVAGLCEVVCEVGGEMLASIAEAAEGGERGGDRLMEDVANRVERELGFAIPFLLEEPTLRSVEKLDALERVATAVFELAIVLPCSPTEFDLSPISLLLELELLARDLESLSPATLLPSSTSPRLARLIHLNSLAASSSTPFAAHLTHFTASRTSYTLSTVSATLASLSLHAIDALLLSHTLDAYSTLPDVKATQGRGVLEKSAFFERLKDAEGKSLGAAGERGASAISSDAVEGAEKKWRYEEMVSGYVPVTPALLRTAKFGGEAAGIEGSPLGSASLGRRVGGSAGKEGKERTPIKMMFALRGRLRPRASKTAERRGGRSRRQETTTSDLEDADDDEDEDEDDTPGRPTRRAAKPIQILDLSMDASDSETATSMASDGDVLILDSDGVSSTAASEQEDSEGDDEGDDEDADEDDTSTSHLRYEILDTVPSPFPTSEVDDLDLLGGRSATTMLRKRSGSDSTIRGGVSPRKRKARLVCFEVEDSEESTDELGF
ncbi:hypothetical protein BCR35DRAFT_333408 [Leucosporidium creatinivorum]|uniref:Uncharacterized protein n=1 Tax=Leucosporidium creatinivorum TaxID=106004 RepID=A0A1Y2ERW2_9BASI|nr:hypothetical protein BCR35DRAFT_333408 [Leucosporidium creatinivorum]